MQYFPLLPLNLTVFPSTKESFKESLVRLLLQEGSKRLFTEYPLTLQIPVDAEEAQTILRPFRASKIGACGRLLWVLRYEPQTLPEEVVRPKTRYSQHVGKIIEEYMNHLFLLSGYPLSRQQELLTTTDGLLTGHIDGVLSIPSLDDVVIEGKALSHSTVSHIYQYGIEKIKPEYYAQIQTYLELLNFSEGFFVIFDRDEVQFYVLQVKRDKAYFDFITEKYQSIAAQDDPFKIEQKYMVRDCFFCPLRSSCQELEKDFEEKYLDFQKEKTWLF